MKRLTFKNMLKRMSKNLNLPRKKKENFKSPVKIPLSDDKKAYNTNTEEVDIKKASDISQAESTFHVSEKNKIEESVSETSYNEYHETRNLIHHHYRNF